IEPDWKLDGVDLMPYLTGKVKDPPHPVLYWRVGEQWAVPQGDFKLLASGVGGGENVEHFHLKGGNGGAKEPAGPEPGKGEGAEGRRGQVECREHRPALGPGEEEGQLTLGERGG